MLHSTFSRSHRVLRGGRMVKTTRGFVSLAPLVVAGSVVLGAGGATASECGPYTAPNDTITCDTGTYTTTDPISYGGVDGVTLTLDDPVLDLSTTGAAVNISSDPASTNDISINAERFRTITTTGGNGFGLAAQHSGNDGNAGVTLSNGDIVTSGDFGFGIYGHITNTGSTGDAIATMNGGSLTLSGANSRGVYTRNQGLGDATSTLNGGTVTTTGVQGWGVFARIQNSGSSGAVTAVMNDGIVETSGDDGSNIAGVSGIYALNSGTGSVSATLNNGRIITSGENSRGVFARSTNASSTATVTAVMNDGIVSTNGNGAHGIYALHQAAGNVEVTMDNGLIQTAGDGANGVNAFAFNGGNAKFEMNEGEIIAAGDGVRAISLFNASITIHDGVITSGTGQASGIRTISPEGSTIVIGDNAVVDGSNSGIAIRDGDFDLDGVDENGGNTDVTSSGTVIGDAILGLGDDTFNLTGGRIEGNIYGDDPVATNNDGDDVFNWSGGILAGSFFGGNGSDEVTVGIDADLSELVTLDGGNDYSSADGWVDVLTFDGWAGEIDGGNVINWEQIFLSGGAEVGFGSSLKVGVDGSDVAEDNMGLFVDNSTLLAAGGFDLTGNLTNNGELTTVDGEVGDVVTVSGSYSGTGTLVFDVDFSFDTADTLLINGNVSEGSEVSIAVNVVGGDGTGETVRLITVGGDNRGEYTLAGGPIQSGVWTYDLLADQNVDLVAQVNSIGSVYESAPSVLLSGFASLPTLEQRVGQRQWLSQVDDGPDGVWMRLHGERARVTPAESDAGSSWRSNRWGLQLGADFLAAESETGYWVLGVTGQYGTVSADVSNALGDGSIRAAGWGLGATATWHGYGGTYVDLQGQANWISARYSTDAQGRLASNRRATAYALSAELGHRVALDENSALVPQAQLSWGQVSGGSFTDSQGNDVKLGTNSRTTGRLGLAYEYRPNGMTSGQRGNDEQMVYGIVNILHDFSSSSSVDVGGTTLRSRPERTWGEIGVGGSVAVAPNAMLYGQASYRQALSSGSSGNNALSGTVGLRFQW